VQPSDHPGRNSAIHALRLDVKGTEVRQALQDAGVATILIKGPAFARLLYSLPSSRPYDDVDLLVDPRQLDLARRVLNELDFESLSSSGPAAQTDPAVGAAANSLGDVHSEDFVRVRDGVVIDLHDGLPEVSADKLKVWNVIGRHLETIDVGGVPTLTLNRSASAVLVALHAAHHGPGGGRVLTDLDRATTVFDLDCWRHAAGVAAEIEAEEAFGVGLGLLPEGRSIAHELGISSTPSAALRLMWSGAPWSSAFLQTLADQPGAWQRLKLIAQVVWPTPTAMHRGSALARRGRLGLTAAHAARLFALLRRLPEGVRTRKRLRSGSS
jgi:hypothetical protein